MSAADEARAVLLAFAQQMHRACGLRTLDGAPTALVYQLGTAGAWRAEAHLTGSAVVGRPESLYSGPNGVAATEDNDAGVWAHAPTPEAAARLAVGAWRESMRRRRADAERAEANAREAAEGYRRICAEVGA